MKGEIPLRALELNVNSTLMWKMKLLSVIPLVSIPELALSLELAGSVFFAHMLKETQK